MSRPPHHTVNRRALALLRRLARDGWRVHFSYDRFAYLFRVDPARPYDRPTAPADVDAVRLLLRQGWVEREPGWEFAYRITEAGRARLASPPAPGRGLS